MNKEQKELLLKDISSRIPYDIKCKIEMWKGFDVCTIYNINSIGYVEIVEYSDSNGINIERIKPYLFPLSSMNKEQIKEFNSITQKCNTYTGKSILLSDFCNKHHIDWRGLIPMGLAEDATDKNIY